MEAELEGKQLSSQKDCGDQGHHPSPPCSRDRRHYEAELETGEEWRGARCLLALIRQLGQY